MKRKSKSRLAANPKGSPNLGKHALDFRSPEFVRTIRLRTECSTVFQLPFLRQFVPIEALQLWIRLDRVHRRLTTDNAAACSLVCSSHLAAAGLLECSRSFAATVTTMLRAIERATTSRRVKAHATQASMAENEAHAETCNDINSGGVGSLMQMQSRFARQEPVIW